MIYDPEKLTLCLVPTSALSEVGNVNDVDGSEKSTVKQFTKWKIATTFPDGLKIYVSARLTAGVYALPVISEWEDIPGTKTESMIFG